MKCLRCGREAQMYKTGISDGGEPFGWWECSNAKCWLAWSADGLAVWWRMKYNKNTHRVPWGCLLVLESEEV